MFILNIFELLQIDYVFVLYFLETHLHLIHLFIQRFVIFLYAHQFLLSPLLLYLILLFFLLLTLQFLLQFFDLLQFVLIGVVGNLMREMFL